MHKCIPFIFICMLIHTASAQESAKSAYTFTDKVKLPVSEVKNQNKSGTCWSFSGLAMYEADYLKDYGKELDLAEMFIVRKTYEAKAIRYVRMHGKTNFASGGESNDVRDVIATYGVMPEAAYPGLCYGETKHVHSELDNVLLAYLNAIIAQKKISTAWLTGFNALLDSYLGPVPESFSWNGKNYTPTSFRDEVFKLKANDYKLISSFTHHPFNSSFIVEIPDNWSWESAYNVDIDKLMQTIDYSLNKGYSVAWAADVSEKGFSWKNGIAVVPETSRDDLEGSERSKWEELSEKEKQDRIYSFGIVLSEKEITQALRQQAFDNYETTDDHGMLICGIAYDQNNTKYYLVKNSWSTDNPYEGFLYASEAYVRYKTISILLNKKGISSELMKQMEKPQKQ